MGGIKYYRLAKGEEMPDEFCAVRDIGGEPSEYTFYVPEVENAKLRELLQRLLTEYRYMRVRPRAVYLQHEERMRAIEEEIRELGVEVG